MTDQLDIETNPEDIGPFDTHPTPVAKLNAFEKTLAKLAEKREQAHAKALATIEANFENKRAKAQKVREEKVDQAYAICEEKVAELHRTRLAEIDAINEAFNGHAPVANGHDV